MSCRTNWEEELNLESANVQAATLKLWLLEQLRTTRQPQTAGSAADGNYRFVKRGFVFMRNTKGPTWAAGLYKAGSRWITWQHSSKVSGSIAGSALWHAEQTYRVTPDSPNMTQDPVEELTVEHGTWAPAAVLWWSWWMRWVPNSPVPVCPRWQSAPRLLLEVAAVWLRVLWRSSDHVAAWEMGNELFWAKGQQPSGFLKTQQFVVSSSGLSHTWNHVWFLWRYFQPLVHTAGLFYTLHIHCFDLNVKTQRIPSCLSAINHIFS